MDQRAQAFHTTPHAMWSDALLLIASTAEARRVLDGFVGELKVRLFSEAQAARAAAVAANDAKNAFQATMSHEIRAPMNAITGMTGRLRETALDAEQLDFVETTRASSEALLTHHPGAHEEKLSCQDP